MKINCFSITFWFNIFKNHQELLEVLQNFFKSEYDKYDVFNVTDNLLAPVITAINNKTMTNICMSQLNLQYNMDKVTWKEFPKFKEKVLNLFEILEEQGLIILHTAIFINGELVETNALNKITKHTLNKSLINEDLIDVSLKLGKKDEDLFYKVINILNKKQLKLAEKYDEQGNLIPLPVVSWYDALASQDFLDIAYEINDKYSFDFTKNYHTTEFYLNKMLYIVENNFINDINNLLDKGEF